MTFATHPKLLEDMFDTFGLNYNRVPSAGITTATHNRGKSTFPPYNVLVNDIHSPTKIAIELAVAGFSKSDISIRTRKNRDGNMLIIIEGEKVSSETDDTPVVVFRTLAGRQFKKEFIFPPLVKVVGAQITDGLLRIDFAQDVTEDTDQVINIV